MLQIYFRPFLGDLRIFRIFQIYFCQIFSVSVYFEYYRFSEFPSFKFSENLCILLNLEYSLKIIFRNLQILQIFMTKLLQQHKFAIYFVKRSLPKSNFTNLFLIYSRKDHISNFTDFPNFTNLFLSIF